MKENTNLPFELVKSAKKIFPALFLVISLFIILTSSNPYLSLVLLILIPVTGILSYLVSRHYKRISFDIIWIINGINIFLLTWFGGKESPVWIMALPYITGALMLIRSKKLQSWVIITFIIGLLTVNYLIGRTYQESLIILFILSLITVLMERTFTYLRNQTLLINDQKTRIEEKQREILDSINYAQKLQSAILPAMGMVKTYLPESFIFFKPKDIVAGDFYWIEHHNGKIFYSAADCTGHGVPGAMVSIMCSDALTRAVKEFGLSRPGEILDKAAELLADHFTKSEEEVKDGMDLALCCMVPGTNTIEFAGANNPLYLIRNGELLEYNGDRQPVGKYERLRKFSNHSIPVFKGDCIYLFSDGFADQFGGPKQKKFKSKSLKELLLSVSGKDMDVQGIRIREAFEAWRGDLEQVDDVCFVGVRIIE